MFSVNSFLFIHFAVSFAFNSMKAMPVAGHMSMDCMVAANKDCKIVGPSMVKVLCKAMVADMDLVDMGLAGMGLDMVQHMDLDMVVASNKYHRDVH